MFHRGAGIRAKKCEFNHRVSKSRGVEKGKRGGFRNPRSPGLNIDERERNGETLEGFLAEWNNDRVSNSQKNIATSGVGVIFRECNKEELDSARNLIVARQRRNIRSETMPIPELRATFRSTSRVATIARNLIFLISEIVRILFVVLLVLEGVSSSNFRITLII